MTIPRVGVIINYKDEYLCVFQEASRLWGFPKGRLQAYESYKEGACRELLEETGIRLYPYLLDANNSIHIKRGKHHHYYFLKTISKKPDVCIDNYEIIDYNWMTLEELSGLKTSYFTEQVLKRLLPVG